MIGHFDTNMTFVENWSIGLIRPWHMQYASRSIPYICWILFLLPTSSILVWFTWFICPYPSGLLPWHWGNLMIAPVPVKQSWKIWAGSTITKWNNNKTQQSRNYRHHSWWHTLSLHIYHMSFGQIPGVVMVLLNYLFTSPQDIWLVVS